MKSLLIEMLKFLIHIFIHANFDFMINFQLFSLGFLAWRRKFKILIQFICLEPWFEVGCLGQPFGILSLGHKLQKNICQSKICKAAYNIDKRHEVESSCDKSTGNLFTLQHKIEHFNSILAKKPSFHMHYFTTENLQKILIVFKFCVLR